ncbi:NAD-dependent epimerase/dehydratase family protein [Limisphaera sp. VF-2]|uniref:NAD-dependent epimerase/dehydratase family protein n=1 Tax=Limisphaera sp. VF-2 TaxID=3400418 RepID=UPI003C24EFB4
MRLLITGANGFIGAACVRAALARGHTVAGLKRPGRRWPADLPPSDRLRWLEGTLADPPWAAIETFAPEVCLHAAWVATPGVYLDSPENEVLFRESLAFLQELAQRGTRHLVGVGTCIEYQITHAPLSEVHTPIAPTTPYARAKNALREALEARARESGWRFVWGRVFYPYGPGEHPARLCTWLLQQLRRGQPVTLKTPQSRKDYIFITDLAEAILLTLESGIEGPINWGTGQGVTVLEIARTAADLVGRPELLRWNEPAAPDPFDFVVADVTRLRQLGWQPRVGLREGLARLLESLPAP